MSKSPDAFRTISEVADWLGVQAHVLRFWESKFNQVKPVKRAGGRRYYRPSDMLLLGGIKKLLHDDGLTIKGVQKMMREQGVAYVSDLSQPLDETADEIVQERPAQGATIVRFADRAEPPAPVQPAKPEIEEAQFSLELGAETAAPDPEPEVLEPDEPEAPAEALPQEPVAVDPAIESPALPSFLHRPMAQSEPEPAPEPAATVEAELSEPETIEDPVAEVAEPAPAVDATITDPPDAGDLPYHPGALERLTRIDRLSPELAEEIAPLARQLRQWHDRAVKLGTG